MSKGIIRAHNKKPFAKSTEEEVEQRIQYVEELLRTGPILKHKLKDKIKKKFKVDWRQANEYIASARARLLLHVQKLKEEHRADSIAWWEGNLLDKKYSNQEKQTARKQIDDLLGLKQPTQLQVDHSGQIASAQTVSIDKLELPLETRKQLLEAVRKKHGATA
jgi:hypothetical protein